MIRRSSTVKQRDRGAPRWMRVRFTLTAQGRECEKREYPIERRDNKEMQEPADVKIVMTHGFVGGHIEVSSFSCHFFSVLHHKGLQKWTTQGKGQTST